MPNHNFNHFTGKTKLFQTQKRKKKVKSPKNHKNKYAKFSQNQKPKYTNGY